MKNPFSILLLTGTFIITGCGNSESEKSTSTTAPGSSVKRELIEEMDKEEPMTFVKIRDLTSNEAYDYRQTKMNCTGAGYDFDSRLKAKDVYLDEYATNGLMKTHSSLMVLSRQGKAVLYKWDLQKTTLENQNIESISSSYKSEIDISGQFKGDQPAIKIGIGKSLKPGCTIRTDAPGSERWKNRPSTHELGLWKMRDGRVLEAVREITFKPMSETCESSTRAVERKDTSVWSAEIVRRSAFCLPESIYSSLITKAEDGEVLDDVQSWLKAAPIR